MEERGELVDGGCGEGLDWKRVDGVGLGNGRWGRVGRGEEVGRTLVELTRLMVGLVEPMVGLGVGGPTGCAGGD